MARNRLPRNAPCPCGSGKKYKQCCFDKGFEWLVDEDGNVFKSIPMPDELGEIVAEQRQRFVAKFGREPEPDENLFFDAPPVERIEHEMAQAMKEAGIDPAMIHAFEKTGLLVTEENEHLLPDADLAEWEAAIQEYHAKHGDGDAPEADADELF